MVKVREEFFETVQLSTQALHSDDHLAVGPAVSPPVSVSTTFVHNDKVHLSANYGTDQVLEYSRFGSPVISRVESVISTICNGYAVVHSSGLTALMSLVLHFRPNRIVMNKGYVGSKKVIKEYLRINPCAVLVGIDEEYKEGDFVLLETPINPLGTINNIRYYANKAHAVNATLVVDSTFAPPPLCDPFKQGADIVLHSATKYLGGHADVLVGVVVAKCQGLADKLHEERNVYGTVPGSLESWLLLRSLRTLDLRVRHQSKSAAMLVAWLHNIATNPECSQVDNKIKFGTVTKVYHASLQQFEKGFDVCAQHPNGFGAVFSVQLSSKDQALWVARNLKLSKHATSLGDVSSLVEWRHGDDETVDPRLLRISVGLENIEDLKNDWRCALMGSTLALAKL